VVYTGDMLNVPEAPHVNTPDLFAAWGGLPIRAEISPVVLAVFLALAGIFVAGVTVVLIYHWRRFPFEHETFRWAERLYLLGTSVLLGVALLGIIIAA